MTLTPMTPLSFAAKISVTAKVDYVPQCISHRAERSLGTDNTTSTETSLKCTTEWSSYSGNGDGDSASVSCDKGDVMTSCWSMHKVSILLQMLLYVHINHQAY